MQDLDKNIFENKKLSDLLKEIYDNHKKKDKQVSVLINELKPLIETIGDATLVVPLVKEYLDIGIKNDDLLIKMTILAQKSVTNQTSVNNEFGITAEERKQLLSEAKQLNQKSE